MRTVATQLFVVACVFGAAVAGCTVKSTDTDVPNDNTTDAAGGSGGSAGSGGTAGSGGSAGVTPDAGDEGTGGAAGDDAGEIEAGGSGGGDIDGGDEGDGGLACLGDTFSSVPDCDDLPYANTACPDGNGGTYAPAGVGFCQQASTDARSGVFESFYACLANLADPCDDNAVLGCIDGTFTQSCTTTEATTDCAAIAQSCPSDPDASTPFDEGTCVAYMSALRTSSAAIVKECYDQAMADPDAGATECGAVFSQCISAF